MPRTLDELEGTLYVAMTPEETALACGDNPQYWAEAFIACVAERSDLPPLETRKWLPVMKTWFEKAMTTAKERQHERLAAAMYPRNGE